MSNKDHFDWEERREGYLPASNKFVPVVAVPQRSKTPKQQGNLLSVRAEERIASLIAAAGTIWAVYVATTDYNNLWRFEILPPGPVEICTLGILAWLHAKWRRSLKN
jgi:hypothetical protein